VRDNVKDPADKTASRLAQELEREVTIFLETPHAA
jgi:hypothetical protein